MSYSIVKIRQPEDGRLITGLPQEGVTYMLANLKKFDDSEGDYWVFPWPDDVPLPGGAVTAEASG